MTRGKARKPKAQLKLTGAYRDDRHDSPDAPVGNMTMPDYLTKRAQTFWPDLSARLEAMHISSPHYEIGLALLCDALADWVQCAALVATDGLLTTTTNGNRIQHPAYGAKNRAWKRVIDACREFGMTPLALRGMPMPDVPQDGLEKLLSG